MNATQAKFEMKSVEHFHIKYNYLTVRRSRHAWIQGCLILKLENIIVSLCLLSLKIVLGLRSVERQLTPVAWLISLSKK